MTKHVDLKTKTLPCTDCQIPTQCGGDAVGVTCCDCTQKRLAKYNQSQHKAAIRADAPLLKAIKRAKHAK